VIIGLATSFKNEPPYISMSEKLLESNDFHHPTVEILTSQAFSGAEPDLKTRFYTCI